MTGARARVAAVFVRPALPAGLAVRARQPAVVALACHPADAWAAAGAAALGLRAGDEPAAVAVLGPARPPAVRAPASRPARGLAGALRASGIAAEAAGRTVRASLPGGEAAAVAAVERIAAVCAGPVVLALTGPRSAPLDALLARLDAVAVVPRAGADAALTAATAASLADLGRPVAACGALPAGPERAAAAAGAWAGPGARRAFGPLAGAIA
ncbi:MAG: hypothetical protein U0R70_02930 [Solirubrobacteraceae bacterium]